MSDQKNIILEQIIGVQIDDWLKHKNEITYSSSWTSGFKTFRFTTETTDKWFKSADINASSCMSGCYMIYEIENQLDNIKISCSIGFDDAKTVPAEKFGFLLSKSGTRFQRSMMYYSLTEWNISINSHNVIKKLENFYNNDFSFFGLQLSVWQNEYQKKLEKEAAEAELYEGARKAVFSNKYERNPEARRRCIEYYGPCCQICGFDFGKVYGEAFEGRIDVHHIKPVSEIGKAYVVDPIKDLIPVCPNCHAALHYKADGVYLPDEIKKLMNFDVE